MMMCFIRSLRHRWYRKKKYFIPISLLLVVFVAAAILGSALRTRSVTNNSGIVFHALSNPKATISHIVSTDRLLVYTLNNVKSFNLTKAIPLLHSFHLSSLRKTCLYFVTKHPSVTGYS